ncbi:hypothetical protein [Actinoallomurus sp. CA-142502]|uniref:hypothetical protein n=1 Tax=Actinoallomurus sp. CA-142502 TaxID=3239885 RepID=UPI003D8E6C1B
MSSASDPRQARWERTDAAPDEAQHLGDDTAHTVGHRISPVTHKVSSVCDPRQARWERVDAAAAIVRAAVPSLPGATPEALLADVTAGLTTRFTCVLPIDVTTGPRDARRGSVRFLHAAVAPDGEGVAIETLLHGGEVTCWVCPAQRYAAERAAARRAMAGRPPQPGGNADPAAEARPTIAPVNTWKLSQHCPAAQVPTHDTAEPRPTVATAQTWILTQHGPTAQVPTDHTAEPRPTVATAQTWVLTRRGPTARIRPDDTAAEDLPASLLPLWIAATTRLGPRPAPADRRMLITTRPALDRLLALSGPDEAAVRTALDDRELPADDAARLADLVRGLVRRWQLDWASNRLEIIDATSGLWHVRTGLPAALTSELPAGETPVALARTTAADVWHDLTLTLG